MTKPLERLCDKVAADEICCSTPAFIAIITNPTGLVVLSPQNGDDEFALEIIDFEGEANIETESGNYSLSALHEAVVLPIHGIKEISFSDDFKGYVVAVLWSFCTSIVMTERLLSSNKYEQPVIYRLKENAPTQNYYFFEWMKCVLRDCQTDSESRLRQLLRSTFGYYLDYHEFMLNHTSVRNDQLTLKFKCMLDRMPSKQQNVAFCAERLAVSKRSLEYAIRDSTGKSPAKYIDEHKVGRAKDLIKQMAPTDKFQAIAESLGFSTTSAFSRFFKSQAGVTPSMFRKALLK